MSSQIFWLTDHKTGTTLSGKIMGLINRNIKSKVFYLFQKDYSPKNKYIVIIRNPKEIIISGYLYHKNCREEWTYEKNGFYYKGHITNMFTQESIKENEKNIELAKKFSSPISYKEKLNSISQTDGIKLEMNSAAYLTIIGMYNLPYYGKNNCLYIKLEEVMFNHDITIRKICKFLNVNNTEQVINNCKKHNVKILTNPLEHSTNKNYETERYKKFWNDEIESEFVKLFPKDIMEKFNYK